MTPTRRPPGTRSVAVYRPNGSGRERPVRSTRPIDTHPPWQLLGPAGRVLPRVLDVAGLLVLGVLWVLRPVLALLERLAVVVAWVGLAAVAVAAAAGHLPTGASTGSASGSDWDRLPALVQFLAVAFPAALVAVLVWGAVSNHRHATDHGVWAGVDPPDDGRRADHAYPEPVEDRVQAAEVVHGWTCRGCRAISSTPARSRPEALHLAGVHDRLWHGGAPTAQTITVATHEPA